MIDLARFIGDLQTRGNLVVLCIDATETPQESMTSKGPRVQSIKWLIDSTNMMETFYEVHGQRPPSTTTTPNRFVDRVYLHGGHP